MKVVAVFVPSIADIGPVTHIRNQNVFDSRLHLRLLHGLTLFYHNQDKA